MAAELTFWFFKAKVPSTEAAIAVEHALAAREKPSVRLQRIDADKVLAALKTKYKRLKVNAAARSAELDLPARQTFMQLFWTPTSFKAVFEGDFDKTLEEVAAVMGEHGCGMVYGDGYFPATEPYGYLQTVFPEIEVEPKIYRRVRQELARQFPGDPDRVEAELDRRIADGTLQPEIDKAADAFQAKYCRTKPPDVVARTEFMLFGHYKVDADPRVVPAKPPPPPSRRGASKRSGPKGRG